MSSPRSGRIKVLVCLQAVPHGGGTYQYNFSVVAAAAHLDRKGYDVQFAGFHPDWAHIVSAYGLPFHLVKRRLLDLLLWRFFTVFRLPVSLWRKFFYRIDRFHRWIIENNFDVGIFPSQDEHSFLAPIPISIVSVHDLMHRYEPEFPEVGSVLVRYHREYLYSNISRYATLILTDSELGRQHICECFGRPVENMMALPYVAPNYVHHRNSNDGDQEILARLPKKFFFYPAQFWAHKNHLRLIQALKKLHEMGILADLVLTGSKKNNYEAVVRLIDKLGLKNHVHIFGYVSNETLVEIYLRARALIMPTFFGPTNIPPLEAMVLGCPVAISGIYAMKEQLGDSAIFFDPKSVNEIAQAMKELWVNQGLWELMRQRGLEHSGSFTQERFTQRFIELVERVILQKPHRFARFP